MESLRASFYGFNGALTSVSVTSECCSRSILLLILTIIYANWWRLTAYWRCFLRCMSRVSFSVEVTTARTLFRAGPSWRYNTFWAEKVVFRVIPMHVEHPYEACLCLGVPTRRYAHRHLFHVDNFDPELRWYWLGVYLRKRTIFPVILCLRADGLHVFLGFLRLLPHDSHTCILGDSMTSVIDYTLGEFGVMA